MGLGIRVMVALQSCLMLRKSWNSCAPQPLARAPCPFAALTLSLLCLLHFVTTSAGTVPRELGTQTAASIFSADFACSLGIASQMWVAVALPMPPVLTMLKLEEAPESPCFPKVSPIDFSH